MYETLTVAGTEWDTTVFSHSSSMSETRKQKKLISVFPGNVCIVYTSVYVCQCMCVCVSTAVGIYRKPQKANIYLHKMRERFCST